jgi:hypothetical protein
MKQRTVIVHTGSESRFVDSEFVSSESKSTDDSHK